MTTNLKIHSCNKMPRMANIEYNKQRHFGEGFELSLNQIIREGKITPQKYTIKIGIQYCPFCGEELIAKPHLESCNCELCEVEKIMRGENYEQISD